MKRNPIELGNEIRDQLTTIAKVKGIHHAGIVESATNLINLNLAFSQLVPPEKADDAKAVFIIADSIVGTAVSLMVGLWKTSGFEPKSKEDETKMYDDCQKVIEEINKDIISIQKKQQEYANS